MRVRFFIPLVLLILLTLSSCSVQMTLHTADKQFGNGEYFAAASLYGKAYSRYKSSEKKQRAYAAFRRGECFRKLNQSIKAEGEYKKALRYQYPNDTLTLTLARVLHKNAKYNEATTLYEQYLTLYPDDTLAQNGLYACNHIEQWSQKKTRYTVQKSNQFNSKKGDFSPVLMPSDYSTLLFTSSAKVKEESKPSKITGLPDNNFWVSKLDANKKWTQPIYLDAPLNSEFDEGSAAFSPDGKTVYFTRCVTKSDSIETFSNVSLFKSTRSGSTWSEPEKLSIYRDSTIIYAHPAISPEGKYLYFVSDFKGGYGGKDLWRVEILGKAFGMPENLGPEINTAGDELFPSFRPNGDLYFSSDGLPGFGGLDLFKAVPQKDGSWKVENLMQQINSNGDDFGITFFGKEEKGFFSSNRKEPKGWDKIYSFELPSPLVEVQGIVADRYGEVVPDAIVRMVNDKGLNTKIKTDKKGFFTLQVEKDADYVMLASCRSYLNSSARFYTLNKEKDTTYVQNFSLTPLHKAIRIENVLFEFNKWDLLPNSYPSLAELLKIMLDNPHIVVEIGAHTDRIGTDEYNDFLSGKRAESVVTYLVSQGIDAERLESKGYGKSQPVNVDGYLHDKYLFLPEGSNLTEGYIETLTPEQKEIADQINRRCEFKVLKTTYKLF